MTQTISKHIEVEQFNETTTIRSLIIGFQSNLITLYVDCKEVAKQNMEINFSKLYFEMDEPIVKLFRERKYPLHIDSSVEQAVSRSNCEKSRNRNKNRRYWKDNEKSEKLMKRKETKLLKFDRDNDNEMVRRKKDGNKKRDTRHWYDRDQQQAQQDRAHEDDRVNDITRRGDIPIIHGDCDGKKNYKIFFVRFNKFIDNL